MGKFHRRSHNIVPTGIAAFVWSDGGHDPQACENESALCWSHSREEVFQCHSHLGIEHFGVDLSSASLLDIHFSFV